MSVTEHSPFEGPEKLLEIWFAPSPIGLGKGLRAVPRQTWEDMLEIVQCKVLSVIQGNDIDAYLLSESSLFIEPHRLILKTCGTTLNLLGLPRILAIALSDPSLDCPLKSVYRAFYSRKTFMFPDFQQTPHSSWDAEVAYLDKVFTDRGEGKGNAYVVGKVNGDYWLLWMISPGVPETEDISRVDVERPVDTPSMPDYTIEILMSDLAPDARQPFFASAPDGAEEMDPRAEGKALSVKLGLDNLFSSERTNLDSYAFSPCGYSANAIVTNVAPGTPTEGYYTIHVTPEDGWSYASFESNVPVPITSDGESSPTGMPDLQTLITRVVRVFRPRRLTLTLFVSCMEHTQSEASVDAAHKAFAGALGNIDKVIPVHGMNGINGGHRGKGNANSGKYKRTDKINYEFGGYDLAFASFELR